MTARKVIGCKRLDGGAGCEVTLGCVGCSNAIYEQEDTPPTHKCGSIYCDTACDCREHKVAVLIKAALDVASELDSLQAAVRAAGSPLVDELVDEDKHDKMRAAVERVYDACEQLGEKIGISVDEGPNLCQHVVVVADECAICGCEVTA